MNNNENGSNSRNKRTSRLKKIILSTLIQKPKKKKSKFCDPALIDFYKLYLLHHEFPVLTNHE